MAVRSTERKWLDWPTQRSTVVSLLLIVAIVLGGVIVVNQQLATSLVQSLAGATVPSTASDCPERFTSGVCVSR